MSAQILVSGLAGSSVTPAQRPLLFTRLSLPRRLSGYSAGTCATPRVVLNAKGLSDKAGTVQIAVVGEGAGTNSIVPDSRQPVKYFETAELTTVDEYCRLTGISSITLLKIDAEGHDLFVLRGAREMLCGGRIAVAQFEYNHRWIWSRAFLLDVFDLAHETGYQIGKVTRRGIEFYKAWHQELEHFQEGNYLLCRSDWAGYFPRIRWWGE
jgi:FkbM family methyltransferase